MNTVSRNLTWLLMSQLATWAMTLVVMWLVPRYLGPSGFGEFSFVSAYVGLFQLAGSLGTSIFMTREIARDRELVGPFVTNGVILKLVVASLLSAMAIGLAAALQFDGVRMALVAIGCGGMFIFLVNEVLAGGISGLQRMGKMSAWATIHVYVSSIASVVLLANGAGIVPYTMVMAWSPVILTVALAVLLLPYVRSHLGVDLHLWRVLVVGGAPLALLTIFNQIYGTVDIPILAALTSTTVVGWYSLAYKWAAIPIFITNAVVGSHYPEMARLGSNPGPEFAGLVNRAVKLTLLASTPAAVGLAVVAPNLIALFYPPAFGPSVRPLQILALQIPITGMDTVLATALIACNRLRRYLVVAGAAAALESDPVRDPDPSRRRSVGQRRHRGRHRDRVDGALRHVLRLVLERHRGDGSRDVRLVGTVHSRRAGDPSRRDAEW